MVNVRLKKALTLPFRYQVQTWKWEWKQVGDVVLMPKELADYLIENSDGAFEQVTVKEKKTKGDE